MFYVALMYLTLAIAPVATFFFLMLSKGIFPPSGFLLGLSLSETLLEIELLGIPHVAGAT